MQATCSFETLVDVQRTTWRYIPEDSFLHNHRCENLKSYLIRTKMWPTSGNISTLTRHFPKTTLESYRLADVLGLTTLHHYNQYIYFVNWLRAGRPRGQSSSPGRVKNFLFSTASRPALVPNQPSIQWVTGAPSLGEAACSPQISAEFKKMWIYMSTPPYAFMA
jgi:hypothetical protein